MIEDRHLIHHTGIAILQVPNGVEWNEGQKAYLVVAIAAQSDEHIALLRRLTRLMQQPDALDTLFHAENPLVLLAALGDAAEPSIVPEPAAPAWPADAEVEWTLDYPNGLHARPATRWVETAKRFPVRTAGLSGRRIRRRQGVDRPAGAGRHLRFDPAPRRSWNRRTTGAERSA